MQQPNTNAHRRRNRSHSGSGSSIGSASTASSRSSTSSAERRRRAKTASLKRQNLPRLRRQGGGKSSGASGKRGVRPGASAVESATPALDPLPYTGPRRLSYIPESSAEWDDIENSSHDDGSMDTDDMEARLEELEAEARRSSDFGLGDDDNVEKRRGHPNDRKQQQPKQQSSTTMSSSARSDFDVPLEDSLDDFMRRKSSLSQGRKTSEVTDGADVSGVWSNVANEFGSVSGQRGSRRASVGSKEDSLPSLDLTEHTGNTSGRSLEYSWSSTNKGDKGGRWNSRGSSHDRPMPRRSGSGADHSSTDSWGAPRVDDGDDDDGQKGRGGAADAATNDDRPHARLHRLSTGNLSCDTWDSSSGISYGGDSFAAENDGRGGDGGDGGDGDQNDNDGGGGQNYMANSGADAGNDEDYDHRSSISTNESGYRAAAAAVAATAAAATVADTVADGSQMNLGGADAAAGLGSSDHGGLFPVVGDDYMIGLNDVVDMNDDRLGRFSGKGTDGKNEDEDGDNVDDDGRPNLNPHDRLHHMSNDALSCDTSGWDSKAFDNIDEMGLGGNSPDEENQRQEVDEGRRPHNRLHRMSIDDMSVESGSQTSRSYDSRAVDVTGNENRASISVGDDQSAAAQSTSAASWVSMSRTARSIVNDVVNSIKGTGVGAAPLPSSAQEQEHNVSPDVGIYEEEYLEDAEAYGVGAVGMGYGETYDLDGKDPPQDHRSVERHLAQRASRPDNYGAERLHRMSMDTIDADDLSSATPLSAQGTAQQSAIQLDPSGSVSYYEHDVAMSPETKGSRPNLFKSLGESVRRLAARSSGRKVPRDKVTPTPQEDFEDYGHEDNGGYDGYDGHSHGEASYNEMEHSAKPSRSKRESWFAYIYHHMWYFLLGTCLLLGTIILIVFLVKRDSGGSDNAVDTASQGDSNSPIETKDGNSPSISRTPAEIRRKDTIQAKLVEMGISDISAFGDASSPQKAALEWLSFDDEAQLDANDQYLPSRYSLAVFYLSANLAKNEERRQQDLFEAPVASEQVDEWVNSSNWMSSAGICSWSGIECVPQWNNPEETKFDGDGEITHLVLPSNNIHSSLPAELFSSFGKSLRVLDLSNNRLTSSIPDEINQLAKIEKLDLGKNALTGRMPNISNLQALQTLRLGLNELSGEVSTLEELEALVTIDLQSNDFTGEFDLTKLHRAINLKEIRVSDNGGLSGVLPYQFGFFGFMSRVEVLDLSGNSFDGTIPRAIKNMKGLVQLNISGNRLTGELPDTLGELYEMEVLHISDNQFEGISMPSSVCELKDNHNLNVLVADCRDDFGGGMNAKVFCTCCTECV